MERLKKEAEARDAREVNETQEIEAGQPLNTTGKIKDIKEKRLVIARYFIRRGDNGKKFGERDMFCMWSNYFPDDFRAGK